MSTIPLHLCLVAVQTATGAVTFLVTRHPAAQIEHLGMQLQVDRSLVVTTAHAERIANELRTELAAKQLTTFGAHPYFAADWEDVEKLIAEFDPVTGSRLRREGVELGARVQVALEVPEGAPPKNARGEVTGIHGRRYLVRLDKPLGAVVSLWAPRNLIKPIVRTCAIVGAA